MNSVRFKPLYQQIEDSLLERIYAGEWPPGTFLPSEFALADEYGVSQGTLRKALESLTTAKHLVRFQGKGTQVADLDHGNSIFPFYFICDLNDKRIFPFTQTLYHKVIKAPEDIAKYLHITTKEELVFAERLRTYDEECDEVVLHEEIYIPKKLFNQKELKEMQTLPDRLYAYYITAFGKKVEHALEELDIVMSREADVKNLNVELGIPLLSISRVTYDVENEPFEFRRFKIDPKRYKYKTMIN